MTTDMLRHVALNFVTSGASFGLVPEIPGQGAKTGAAAADAVGPNRFNGVLGSRHTYGWTLQSN